MVAVPWLLIAVVRLAATEFSCQYDVCAFADPPPLPTAGILLCINNTYTCMADRHICISFRNDCLKLAPTLGVG